MGRSLSRSLLLGLVLLPVLAVAQSFQAPRAPTRWATDTAGLLRPATVQQLDRVLQNYERQSGHQVIFWVGRTTGGIPIEDWAVRTFEAWKIGRGGQDDGIGIFLFSEDRKVRIEVGYGLEGDLPDVVAFRIIDQVTAPLMARGEVDAAALNTVAAVLSELGADPGALGGGSPQRVVRERPEPSLGQKIVSGILGLLLLIFIITNPRMALHLLFIFMSSGRGGGGGGGGGGFGGGGGRSGGGGASGSW